MGEIVGPGNIRQDMFVKIIEAEIVICDVSIHNANVFYELGIRHALRKKRTVVIKGGPTADGTPFDLLTDRYVKYDLTNPATSIDALVTTIKAAKASNATDSPVLTMLPELPEADPKTIQSLPASFSEDLARARAAQSKGWLRLLAYEIEGLRFERPARQVVGAALWKAGDFERARQTLERIREEDANDVAANLGLASVYERLYRSNGKPQTLSASDQAIAQVLASPAADLKSRAEALALKGRNQKTRWRKQFEGLAEEADRRAAAMDPLLRAAYEAYRDAFRLDLNHFYPGVAALHLGAMFLDLSTDRDPGWEQSFQTDAEAGEYRKQMEADVATLRAVVSASIDAAMRRGPLSESDRMWAGISRSDLLLLSENSVRRVAAGYKAALPADDVFAWNAVLGQLRLFATLGIRADLARGVIDKLQADVPRDTSDKPLHVVVFAGHRVDEPGRAQPRLPEALLPRAHDEIARTLKPFTDTHRVLGYASAAPGGDIVFHEACAQLGISSTICLPMPEDSYVDMVFDDFVWRRRFLALLEQRKNLRPSAVLALSDGPGLPPWLHGAPTNEWERGNRWVLEMAATSGAAKITLIALWDGHMSGDAPGGTAHMVALARSKADVDVICIDPAALGEPAAI
jgi:hypothetical protein